MATTIRLEPYTEQAARWPAEGRHILAQFDDQRVLVYQAYRPAIADYAIEHGHFGGEFSYTRMSWIKPNFLWMMYRSGWATKPAQERVLGIWLWREYFDGLLARAVVSSYTPELYEEKSAWQEAVARSDVRLQWDPDHDPAGGPERRRAIQLGLRSDALAGFRGTAIDAIEDVTPLVEEQRGLARSRPWRGLMTPREEPYPVSDTSTRARLGLDR